MNISAQFSTHLVKDFLVCWRSVTSSDSYLDGSWFDEANVFNTFHDLWVKLKGLQKGATGTGNGTLLPLLLQVVHKDVMVFFPVDKHSVNEDTVGLVERVEDG